MRIYELAKELGVENKVVLVKAAELGMGDKTSHSNSLRPDEADKIRRAVLRQASGAATTNTKSETVTKRVDKATGATESLVEKRVGNVIRRRKQNDVPEEAEVKAEKPTTLAEDIFITKDEPARAAADEREDLFHAKAPVETEEEVEVSEIAVVEEVEDEDTEVAASEEVKPGEAVVTKPTAGPRVLGRMDLPVKRVITKPEPKRAGAAFSGSQAVAVVADDEEEDEFGKKKSAFKKKTKKREISRIDLVDYEGRDVRRISKTSKGGKGKGDYSDDRFSGQTEITKPKASKRVVKMNEMITVGDLAKQMSLKAGEVISKLMELGMMATINQAIDHDTATIICEEFEFQIESTGFDEKEVLDIDSADTGENLKFRPPVVTVMGHVDHGKTSLLDSIREATVASREHGGITQHIGAYSVKLAEDKLITFIDTPGHAAFTAMRARGAKITDIVILVVAADDGVMPQTVEAINHAKAADVTIVVAVNKMDKPDSKPDRVKQQLAEYGLQPEDWGGDTMFFNVSALKKTGIKELLEGLLVLAEVKELRANPDRRARGTIIESKQDKGRGAVATVLIQAGTLRISDTFVCGAHYGKIRAMYDSNGERITEAGPSYPVEITGMSGIPEAGDDFFVVDSEADARQVSSSRAVKKQADERSLASGPISLEEFSRRANNQAVAELNIIIKADVAGSLDAVKNSVEKLSTPKVKVRALHTAVGAITESDIQLAVASKAVVIGFGVRAEPSALVEAERASIELRFYRVIYELIDDVKKAMVGLLAPIKTEVSIGRVEVREIFNVSKVGTIAGCYVTDGLVKRNSSLRVLRDGRVIHEGKMSTLKRFKDDAREVQSGYECGISLDKFNDVKPGDIFEVYEIQESQATLED